MWMDESAASLLLYLKNRFSYEKLFKPHTHTHTMDEVFFCRQRAAQREDEAKVFVLEVINIRK
jgi:hypothetical protein